MKLVHAPARMQRHAEPVLAFQHEAMKAGRVDAAYGIASADLPGGDVWRAIDRKLQRNRQFAQVDLVAFEHDLVPCRIIDELARQIGLAALPEGTRQIVD